MTEGPGVLERGLTLVKGQVKHDDVRGPDKLLLFKRIFFFFKSATFIPEHFSVWACLLALENN